MCMKENQRQGSAPNRPRRGAGYSKQFIMEIVESIENGLSRGDVVNRHGLARSTLSDWMREYGSAAYHARKQGHLSQQQKSSVVRAIEEGKMTVREAKVAYNISWTPTIIGWLREHRRKSEDLVGPNLPTMSKKTSKQKPVLNEDQLHQMARKLQEAELKIKALNTLIDIAEDRYKIDIRKKTGAKQS